MTQEEKQLLLVDLCGRQPYGVKISVDDDNLFIPRLKYIDGLVCHFYECAWTRYFDEIKPYLRPMSSITKEEKIEYDSFNAPTAHRKVWVNRLDWLLSNHFDFRGLIPMGLALEASEGMYKTK